MFDIVTLCVCTNYIQFVMVYKKIMGDDHGETVA